MTGRTSGGTMNERKARSTVGTPGIGSTCYGSEEPAGPTATAATTTRPTSGCEAAGELTDSLQPDDLEFACGAARAGGQEHTAKALARGLGEASLDARDGPDLAAESHLAQEERVGRHGPVMDRRDEGGEDGEVGGGFDQAHTSRDVDEDVEVPEREAAAPLEHREQQGEAAMIETSRHALWRAKSRLRGERLNLDQHGARAFHQGRHRGAGCPGAAAREERRGGVGDRPEAPPPPA